MTSLTYIFNGNKKNGFITEILNFQAAKNVMTCAI